MPSTLCVGKIQKAVAYTHCTHSPIISTDNLEIQSGPSMYTSSSSNILFT